MHVTLANVRLVDAGSERLGATISLRDGRIVAKAADAAGVQVDASDMIVTPGFIDVHTHGGGGYSLHTDDPAEIQAYARWAPSTGTTAFLIGVVGVPGTMPIAQINAAVQAIEAQEPGAEAIGIHLEGPYINVQRRGAHDPSWLRQPASAETHQLLASARGFLRLVTLAPELPDAHTMTRQLAEAGVTVSIGHTDATYEQARDAIPHGITHATHCFNAMRPLHHREPGALGAIVEAAQVRGELIADGVHVHPAALRVMLRALGPQRTIIVTDALACAGLPDAVFEFAGQPARVIDGVARLADGTITGSVLTMEQALRNLVSLISVPLHEAVGMLTLNPAESAGVADRKGRLQPGYDADLLLLDADLRLHATLCRGHLAYVSDKWRSRLEPAFSA
jgi:N-acetylglucosamine-6-phosphate deacetylase